MADEAKEADKGKEAAPAEKEASAAGKDGAPAEGDAAQAAKAGKKKLLLVASGVLALVGVAVAVGVVFLVEGEKGDEAAAAAVTTAMMDVPEFTVNLLDSEGGGQQYMKIKLALELNREADVASVQALMPRLQDEWGGFLRQLRPSDVKGSAALFRLKEGLLRRAVQSLDPVAVKAVYIREMLLQ